MSERSQPTEEVHVFRDEASGLDATVVLHSTALGPAAGGCRFWSYPNRTAMSIEAMRLAEGMTYKNALAGLPLGGGKAVLRQPAGTFDRQALFRAFGQAVQTLEGRYVTAEDVGTSVEDMQAVAEATSHVAGLPALGHRPGGDPSPWTARGVFLSMQQAAQCRLQRPLSECTVAIQGVGNVGRNLALMVHETGAKLIVADVNATAASLVATLTGATIVPIDELCTIEADVLAPCALGAVLHDGMIGRMAAKVVCGAANNQLATQEDGRRLADREILYCHDYVVNAGGIINVAAEYLRWPAASVRLRVDALADRLNEVLDHAISARCSTSEAADEIAKSLVASTSKTKGAA